MSEVRSVYQVPIHILQEFIVILRTNEKFIGEGRIKDYYILKSENNATVMYDNGKVSFIANFVKDKQGNWFFLDKIVTRDSLKDYITSNIIEEYSSKEDSKLELNKKETTEEGA